jgi:hypothetical protein
MVPIYFVPSPLSTLRVPPSKRAAAADRELQGDRRSGVRGAERLQISRELAQAIVAVAMSAGPPPWPVTFTQKTTSPPGLRSSDHRERSTTAPAAPPCL